MAVAPFTLSSSGPFAVSPSLDNETAQALPYGYSVDPMTGYTVGAGTEPLLDTGLQAISLTSPEDPAAQILSAGGSPVLTSTSGIDPGQNLGYTDTAGTAASAPAP